MADIDYSEYYDKPLSEPSESPQQFARFCIYRDMNPLDRSMRKATEILNREGDDVSLKTIQNTGHKFKWADRAKAYDAKLGQIELKVIEAELQEAVQYALDQEDMELIIATELLHKTLRRLSDAMDSHDIEHRPDTVDIQRIVKTMAQVQDLRRRRSGLPIEYRTEKADPIDLEEMVYTIGGGE